MNNLEWFKAAKFGIMSHFGLYSVLEGEYRGMRVNESEWVRHEMRIPREEYHRLAKAFYPIYFDADEWIRTVKEAGAKYYVITAKHHEGFALFDSEVSDFNVVKATPFRRDIIGEIAESCRKYGIKLGLYYSQDLDWEEENGGGFIENPFANPGHNVWDFEPDRTVDFQSYLDKKAKPQIRELLTKYGDICLMWFDCPWTMSKEQSHDLYHFVKSFQPDCLVTQRIGHDLWDIASGGDNELDKTADAQKANDVPATLSGRGNWGFSVYGNMEYKSAEQILREKNELNEKGINLLLNVGPDHLGRFPGPAVKILKEIGLRIAQDG